MRPRKILGGIALSLVVGLVAAGCSLQVDEREFAPSVDADTNDAAPAGVQLDPVRLTVLEGESGMLTVRATATLTGDVSIDLSASPNLGLSTTEVVLSPSVPEIMVMVTALDDDDAQPGSGMVTAQSPALGLATSQVMVTEDDELNIEVDQPEVTVTEDASTQIRVRLTALPPGDLTVSVQSGDTSIAAVDTGSLFFGAGNWNDFQTVTVAGNHDPDIEDDSTPVHFTATDLDPVDVVVNVNDLDRLAIQASVGSINVTEQGPAVTVGVRLTQMPPGNVQVTAAPGNAGVRADPPSLTFTPQNYAQFQDIAVTALMDDNTDGFTTAVTLSTAEPNVNDLPFTVVVADDDMQGITEDAPSPLILVEDGTGVFHARLAYQPMNNVVVGVSSTDTNVATVSPGALTFTLTDWNQPQTVTVTGIHDVNVAPNNAIIRMAASPLQTDVAVQVTDVDDQDIVIANQPSLVTEGGTATFTVRLAFEPPGPTVVAVSSSDAAIGVTAGASLTFNTTNYQTPQMVTLSAPMDIDVIEESSTITVQTTGLPVKTFNVAVDETSVINILSSVPSVMVTEQAAGVPFNVTLSNPPVGTLVVNISANDPGVGFSPPSLSFTAADFMMPKSVTVSGLTDDDVANINANLTLSGTGATSAVVGVMVIEDDVQSILETAANPHVVAEGTNNTFGVRLAFRPSASVVVNVSSMTTTVAMVSPPTLTFNNTNWDQTQNVTVSGVEDPDVVTSTATVRLQSGALITDVATSVTDNDTQDITLAMQPSTINEGGNATFTVRLAFQPATNTMVTIGSSDSAVTVMNPSLTFTPGNYASPQTVTLNAPTDVDVIAETSTITVSSTGLNSKTFNITVVEGSVVTIVPSVTMMNITEEAVATNFTVTLSNPPASNMTVNIATNNAGVTRNPTQLMFTPGNYNTPQSVAVAALTDDDVAGYSAMLTLSATGATGATVTVAVADDDMQAILENAPVTVDVIDPDGTVPTGVSFGIRLAFRPSGSVTINAAVQSGAMTVSPGSRTFDATNWDTFQNITVTATADTNMADSTGVVRLTSGVLPMVDVNVAIDDQDVQVVETNPVSTMTVTEGMSANLQVRLKYAPAAGTTVALASNNVEVTVPGTLSFTPGNFNTFQNAAVMAALDGDQINDTATVTLSNFDAPTNTAVGVTVTDPTIVTNLGWPTLLASMATVGNGAVLAYKVNVPTMTTLDKFGLVTLGSSGQFKLALYTDAGNVPNMLVASMGTAGTISAPGNREGDITDVTLSPGDYWVAYRSAPALTIGYDPNAMTRLCARQTTIPNLGDAWPTTFGSANCSTNGQLNLYIVTYRNP